MNQDKVNHFERNFDYGSILPLFLFISGIHTIYLLLNQVYTNGFLMMFFSFILYVSNNIIINKFGTTTVFNEYLEDIASYIAFSLSTVVFGLTFFKGDLVLLTIIFFYSICQILSLARNWIGKTKNSRGWPLALNAIFFPFFYFIYIFYLQGFGEAIFVIYFVLVAIFSISEYNFLGYEEDKRKAEKAILDIEKKLKKLP